jgi:hypothetical protein
MLLRDFPRATLFTLKTLKTTCTSKIGSEMKDSTFPWLLSTHCRFLSSNFMTSVTQWGIWGCHSRAVDESNLLVRYTLSTSKQLSQGISTFIFRVKQANFGLKEAKFRARKAKFSVKQATFRVKQANFRWRRSTLGSSRLLGSGRPTINWFGFTVLS